MSAVADTGRKPLLCSCMTRSGTPEPDLREQRSPRLCQFHGPSTSFMRASRHSRLTVSSSHVLSVVAECAARLALLAGHTHVSEWAPLADTGGRPLLQYVRAYHVSGSGACV